MSQGRVVSSVPSELCLQYRVISPALLSSPLRFSSVVLCILPPALDHPKCIWWKSLQSSSQLQLRISGRRTCKGGARMRVVSSPRCSLTDQRQLLWAALRGPDGKGVTPLGLERESRGPGRKDLFILPTLSSSFLHVLIHIAPKTSQ